MWADLKGFVAECRCQNNEDVNAAIRAYATTVTPEKCNNWIDHLKNYVINCILLLGVLLIFQMYSN